MSHFYDFYWDVPPNHPLNKSLFYLIIYTKRTLKF